MASKNYVYLVWDTLFGEYELVAIYADKMDAEAATSEDLFYKIQAKPVRYTDKKIKRKEDA